MKKASNHGSSPSVSGKRARIGFNFIDVLLIAFILAFVVLAINILSPMSFIQNLFEKDVKTIRYTVEFIGVDEDYVDKILENDVVVDSVSKHTLGTVAVVDNNTPYTSLEYNETDGSAVLAAHEGKYNVIVTITASGNYKEGEGYSVNDCRIAVGEKMSLRFPNYIGEGYCVALSVEE